MISLKSLRRSGYRRCLSERRERVVNHWTDSIALETIAEGGFRNVRFRNAEANGIINLISHMKKLANKNSGK